LSSIKEDHRSLNKAKHEKYSNLPVGIKGNVLAYKPFLAPLDF